MPLFSESHIPVLTEKSKGLVLKGNDMQDSCNRKSNQQNLGTIKSSNLCTEIIEYTSSSETAVCNLASIALPRFVREKVYTGIFSIIWLISCNQHNLYLPMFQGVPIESHPAKIFGSSGSKNRYFDFDKLAEVCLPHITYRCMTLP